jgi:hypothetical protein
VETTKLLNPQQQQQHKMKVASSSSSTSSSSSRIVTAAVGFVAAIVSTSGSVNGFVPTASHIVSTKTITTNKKRRPLSSLTGDYKNEDNDERKMMVSLDPIKNKNDALLESTELFIPTTSSSSSDIAKELLLESISRTRPQDVLEDVVLMSVNDSKDDIRSSTTVTTTGTTTGPSSSSSSLGGSKKDDSSATTTTTKFLSSLGISNATTTTTGGNMMNDDVKAILVASEEAVAAAEASMSPELAKQLDIVANNGTTIITSTSSISKIGETTSAARPRPLPEIVPASKVVGEPVTKRIDAPGVAKVLKFAIPAIGVWLCGPLLSLIDTAAVGIFSGTIQQAALNPAVAVTDYAALLIVRSPQINITNVVVQLVSL